MIKVGTPYTYTLNVRRCPRPVTTEITVATMLPVSHSRFGVTRRTRESARLAVVVVLYLGTVQASAQGPWVAESGQSFAQLGSAVATAGDVNGDGFDDVIAGAPFYSNGEQREGAAFVYYGSVTGLSPEPDWAIESNTLNAEFGSAVASAGDVNNDGFDDIVIGAYRFSRGQTYEGCAFLYLGSAGGLSTQPAWSAESNQTFAFFGYSVVGAGDINNDGYDDVVAGASWYDHGQTNEGRVFVYFGTPTGLTVNAVSTVESDVAGAEFGFSVASAGDVNHDGFADIVVGAPMYGNGQIEEGRAFVYLGSASGLLSPPVWSFESNLGDARFGYDVSGGGDVNGDGYDDIVVGAPRFDHGEVNEGRVYVFHGTATGVVTTPSWIIEGDQEWCFLGQSVASAGDVNDDGFADVIVGAYWLTNDDFNEGGARIYYGTELGLLTIPGWTQESNQNDAGFGCSVSSAGDTNGDGFLDVLIGAHLYDNGEPDEGRAFVFFGTQDGVLTGPDSPVITTDGGKGQGADFLTNVAEINLAGTVGTDAIALLVNGSTSGVVYEAGLATWSFHSALLEGPNLFLVVAVDSEGRASIPDRIVVTLDTSLPDAPMITTNGGNGPGANYATNQPVLVLEGTCGTGIETIRVNGETTNIAFVPNATSWSFDTTLNEGPNTFHVTAVDFGGNESPPATITVTLDTVSPDAPIITTNGGNGPGENFVTNVADVLLEGTCSTDTDSIQINGSAAGVAHQSGQAAWMKAITLVEGANFFSVVAYDAAGNFSGSDTMTITLDSNLLNPPVISTDGGNGPGANYLTNVPALALGGTCEPAAELRVNGSTTGVTYTPGETSWSYNTTLAEGPNAFSVTAVNDNGHESPPDQILITLDTVPPAAPEILTNGGADFTTSAPALVLQGTCSTDAASLRVNGSVAGVARVPGSTSWTYTGTLAEGANAYDVAAVDLAGNVSLPASIAITLDTIPPDSPVITTNGGVAFTTAASAIVLEGTCSTESDVIRVNGSMAGVTYTAGMTAWRFDGSLASGANLFTVTAADAAGNLSAPASIVVTRSAGDTGGKLATTVTVETAASEIELGEPILTQGNIDTVPGAGAGALSGRSILVRYQHETTHVDRTAIVSDAHAFSDSYIPSLAGVWTVTARFTGDDSFADSGWSVPVQISVEQPATQVSADLNGDGLVDATDIQLVTNAVLGVDISPYSGDANGDGALDALDVQTVINAALGR